VNALQTFQTAVAFELHRGTLRRRHLCSDYTKAIQLKPDYVSPYVNRSDAKRAKGDLEGAKADDKKALELKPGYGEVQKSLDELNKKMSNAVTLTFVLTAARPTFSFPPHWGI